MEPRFGRDFGDVRVHADGAAATSADAVAAQAYTVGQHIVFGAGRYAPSTPAGAHLLAHELTHTIQQRAAASSIQNMSIAGPEGHTAEVEAEVSANRVLAGASASVAHTATGLTLHRVPKGAGQALGGCGVCFRKLLGGLQTGGVIVHEHVQFIAKLRYPHLLVDEPLVGLGYAKEALADVLSSLGKTEKLQRPKGTDIPDLFDPVAEEPGGKRLVTYLELKPDNDEGIKAGRDQLARYRKKLQTMKEFRGAVIKPKTDLILPPIPLYEPKRPAKCPRQYISIRHAGQGLYLYSCDPPFTVLVKDPLCKCEEKKKKGKKQKEEEKKEEKKKKGDKSGGANRTIGLSIGSTGGGKGNFGVGISVKSSGSGYGTAGATVTYDSHGTAIGVAGAGAAASSQATTAAGVGASAAKHSQSTTAGTASVSAGENVNVTGAGMASLGKGKNVDFIGAGVASKGNAQDVSTSATGSTSSGSAKNITEPTSGGTASAPGSGGQPGTQAGTEAGEHQEGATGTQQGAAGTKVGVDISDLPPAPDTPEFKRAEAEAQRIEKLLNGATPAQRDLMRWMVESDPTGSKAVPSEQWVKDFVTATKDLTPAQVQHLQQFGWEPGPNLTLDQMRARLKAALASKDPQSGSGESKDKQAVTKTTQAAQQPKPTKPLPTPAKPVTPPKPADPAAMQKHAREILARMKKYNWKSMKVGEIRVYYVVPDRKIEDGTSVSGEAYVRFSDGHASGDVQLVFTRGPKSGLSAQIVACPIIVADDGRWIDGNNSVLIGQTFDVARK
jgi:hypothetical protein